MLFFLKTRKKAIRRLKIIAGQVQGLLVMIEEEEDCEKIFPQIKAVKSAFNGFSSEMMKGMMLECLRKGAPSSQKKLEQMIEKFTNL